MAQIKETHPIAPVLPISTNTGIRRGQPRQEPPKDREEQQHKHPDPDDGHHLDEYA